jgi:hypothetical protein
MVFQYLEMVSRLEEATVGIENVDGSDGLEVVYNAPYVHDSLAVWIGLNLGWMRESPVSGTVDVGGYMDIAVIFNAEGLMEGEYGGFIRVMSNDPDEGVVSIPVTMRVGMYISGDCNGDGVINPADVSYLANYLYYGGPSPSPLLSGDVNGDCVVNTADLSYLANYLFFGGPDPQYCNSISGSKSVNPIRKRNKELKRGW